MIVRRVVWGDMLFWRAIGRCAQDVRGAVVLFDGFQPCRAFFIFSDAPDRLCCGLLVICVFKNHTQPLLI